MLTEKIFCEVAEQGKLMAKKNQNSGGWRGVTEGTGKEQEGNF